MANPAAPSWWPGSRDRCQSGGAQQGSKSSEAEQQEVERAVKPRRPLKCSGCGRSFGWSKAKGEAPKFEFGNGERAPARQCAELRDTAACRFAVAQRRASSTEDLAAAWKTAGEVGFVTVFIPGREFTLKEAEQIEPAKEAQRARRLIAKAFEPLRLKERATIKGIGVVEPGIIEVREDGVPVRRMVAMHGHLVIWGISREHLHKLLQTVVMATDTVIRPLEVKSAPTPAGALAYAMKQQDDHRVVVREQGKARFKRKPEGREIEVLRRWCQFPATDAEILIGLRRSSNGISIYRAGAAGPDQEMPLGRERWRGQRLLKVACSSFNGLRITIESEVAVDTDLTCSPQPRVPAHILSVTRDTRDHPLPAKETSVMPDKLIGDSDTQPLFTLTKVLKPAHNPTAGVTAHEFTFATVSGAGRVVLTPAQIDSSIELQKMLHDRGFSASASDTSFPAVRDELNRLMKSDEARVLQPYLVADAGGWWPGGYLLHGQPVPPEAHLVCDPMLEGESFPVPTGCPRQWRRAMKQARHSSAIVVAVSAALSAACLPFRIANSAAGYAIVFIGRTTMGKTFATRAAWSTTGDPSRLLTFRASESGLEHAARVHRHLPLVPDEPKSVRSGHGNPVQHIAYLVEGGELTLLNPAYQGRRVRVETVVITGAEEGSFGPRSAGEEVRFIEVPCASMGPYGIIDQFEKTGVTDDRSAARWFQQILAILEKNHGHAIREFVLHLHGLGEATAKRRIDDRTEKFMALAEKRLGPADAVGLRARRTFAFFCAAGVLASEAKVLPWKAARVRNSMIRCLRWHEERKGGASAATVAQQIMVALRDAADRPCVGSARALEKLGMIYDRKAGEIRATHKHLLKLVGGKQALERGLAQLAGQKLVLPSGSGKLLRQVRYPDGVVRAVCFEQRVLRATA